MPAASDPWVVLGVDRAASYAEARRVYLARSQLLHPDRHQGASSEVLAEAERAMKDLNQAWHEVQRELALGAQARPRSDGPAPSQPAPRPGKSAAHKSSKDGDFTDVEDCIDWIIGGLVEAGRQQGDPLEVYEIGYLMLDVGQAGTRKMTRWLERREVTLRRALDADQRGGLGLGDWLRAYKMVDSVRPTSVLTLLLDRVIQE